MSQSLNLYFYFYRYFKEQFCLGQSQELKSEESQSKSATKGLNSGHAEPSTFEIYQSQT